MWWPESLVIALNIWISMVASGVVSHINTASWN